MKTDIPDVSKAQVSKKVRRIKKKFTNSLEKGILPPPSSSSSSQHERMIHKLCQEIWGNDDNSIHSRHMDTEDFQARYPRTDNSIFILYPYKPTKTADEKDLIRHCIVFVSPNELEELEEEWTNYYEGEVECHVQYLQLKKKQSKLLQMGKQIYKHNN